MWHNKYLFSFCNILYLISHLCYNFIIALHIVDLPVYYELEKNNGNRDYRIQKEVTKCIITQFM